LRAAHCIHELLAMIAIAHVGAIAIHIRDQHPITLRNQEIHMRFRPQADAANIWNEYDTGTRRIDAITVRKYSFAPRTTV